VSTLFHSLRIGNLELENRIIMSPMTRGRANEAGVQPDYTAEYYRQPATAGLIITEATNVSPMAKGYINTPGIYTAEQIESWKKVTDAVHFKAGKIFLQIFHTGRIALPDFLPHNAQPVAPSCSRVPANGPSVTSGLPSRTLTLVAVDTRVVREAQQLLATDRRSSEHHENQTNWR
jgi:N-ethylmaleimide reductase